jgi:hypothetical protein
MILLRRIVKAHVSATSYVNEHGTLVNRREHEDSRKKVKYATAGDKERAKQVVGGRPFQMIPAMRLPSGTVLVGKFFGDHYEIADRAKREHGIVGEDDSRWGFVNRDGHFLSRGEAADYLKQHVPQAHAKLDNPHALEAVDYESKFGFRKAHVSAYDRVSKTGALSHIREHEDSRVRSYARKILGSKDSYDLHTIRKERFGHLPHWNKLNDHTRQAILDAEEEKAKGHKEFEEWKERKDGKPKKDAEKVDRSGWEQGLMFKSRHVRHVAYILRKSDVRGSHHTNKRGTQWNSTGYTDRRVKHQKKPKGQPLSDRKGKTKNQHIADILVKQPILHAKSITGKGWNGIITNAKQWYIDNVYRKPIFMPVFGEYVQFEARSLVYAATKAKDKNKKGLPKGAEEVARRLALLPKAVEVLKNVNSIDPHDIRTMPPGNNAGESNSKDHKRYGLYGRFDDGIVVNVVVEEIQKEGKKFLSVFDFDGMEGSKADKYLEAANSGLAVRPKQQTPGGDLLVPIETISPPKNEINKSHNPLYLVRVRGC